MTEKSDRRPKTKITSWAMWLGLSTILIFPALGIFASAIRPIIDKTAGENIGIPIGFGFGIFSLVLSISALAVCVIAYRKGERSSTLWLGFIPAIITGAFWIFMVIGEFIFPH